MKSEEVILFREHEKSEAFSFFDSQNIFQIFKMLSCSKVCPMWIFSRNKYYDILQYHFMSRNQAFKIFHLTEDNTSEVPEKVFLLEDGLNSLKLSLRESVQVYGLIGPTNKIHAYFAQLQKYFSSTNQARNQDQLILNFSFEFEFELNEEEKAALYAVKLSHKSAQLLFLAFIAPDDFYYTKPLDTKTTHYLLIRFIGDLCSQIFVLYDEAIERNFLEAGCPFSISKKKKAKYQVVTKTFTDVKIVETSCDFKKLFDYDENYSKKLDFQFPSQTKYILYSTKLEEKQLNQRFQKELIKTQQTLWDRIFNYQQTQKSSILGEIKRQEKKQNKKIIEKIIEIQKQIKKLIVQFAQECYNLIVKDKKQGFSQTFKQNIYKYAFCGKVILDYEAEFISFNNRDLEVFGEILCDIKEEASFSGNKSLKESNYVSIFGSLWGDCKLKIIQCGTQFFQVSSRLKHTSQQFEENIDLWPFQISAIYNKEDEIQKLAIVNCVPITLTANYFQSISVPLSNVNKVHVYDLKNNGKSRLVWVEINWSPECQFYSIMLSVSCNNEIKLIRKYYNKLSFTFNATNQKGYLINEETKEITHFQFDSLLRVTNEKKKEVPSKKNNKNKIAAFGITIFPSQKLFYLTEAKSVLYCYDFIENDLMEFDKSVEGSKFLTMKNQPPYDFIRTFNEDSHIVLGNYQTVDIFHPSRNGKLQLKQSIKISESFLGATILVDSNKQLQFLIIHDRALVKSKAYCFLNMNCQNILSSQLNKSKFEGNPIIDIFHGAHEKFGCYKTYTVRESHPVNKKITLKHIANELLFPKISKYLQEIRLIDHEHKLIKAEQCFSCFQTNLVSPECLVPPDSLIAEIQTRIPIQICTLEDGNIVPLNKGKRQLTNYYKELSIAERSKSLNFGVIQQLLNMEPNKKTIVVSVMGAQSTGKSYLMNRIFGTRFTVASSRTTIGIWLSLIKSAQMNFLLLDCEGLFANDRKLNEEEKLIRILTSLSDFTILNQNMGMSNRSLTELMEKIADRVGKTIKKQSKKLYQGELVIVVRDVEGEEADNIQSEFKRNFQTGERKKSNTYIKKLFGGKINVFPIENFKREQFAKDIEELRRTFFEDGEMKPLRSSTQILESIKVVLNQLSCDDSKQFEEMMESLKIQRSKQAILKVWLLGFPEKKKLEMTIRNKTFSISQKQIEIRSVESQESIECLSKFDKNFEQKIIEGKKLSSTEFEKTYQQYNAFLIEFFKLRYNAVDEAIDAEFYGNLKQIPEEKKINEMNQLRKKIMSQQQKLKLCQNKCSECHLPCLSKFGHKENIQFQKQNKRVEKLETEGYIKAKKLTEKENEILDYGVEKKETDLKSNLDQLHQVKQLILKKINLERENLMAQQLISEQNEQIEKGKNSIKQNQESRMKIIQSLQEACKIYSQTCLSIFIETNGQVLRHFIAELKQIDETQEEMKVIFSPQKFEFFMKILKDIHTFKIDKYGSLNESSKNKESIERDLLELSAGNSQKQSRLLRLQNAIQMHKKKQNQERERIKQQQLLLERWEKQKSELLKSSLAVQAKIEHLKGQLTDSRQQNGKVQDTVAQWKAEIEKKQRRLKSSLFQSEQQLIQTIIKLSETQHQMNKEFNNILCSQKIRNLKQKLEAINSRIGISQKNEVITSGELKGFPNISITKEYLNKKIELENKKLAKLDESKRSTVEQSIKNLTQMKGVCKLAEDFIEEQTKFLAFHDVLDELRSDFQSTEFGQVLNILLYVIEDSHIFDILESNQSKSDSSVSSKVLLNQIEQYSKVSSSSSFDWSAMISQLQQNSEQQLQQNLQRCLQLQEQLQQKIQNCEDDTKFEQFCELENKNKVELNLGREIQLFNKWRTSKFIEQYQLDVSNMEEECELPKGTEENSEDTSTELYQQLTIEPTASHYKLFKPLLSKNTDLKLKLHLDSKLRLIGVPTESYSALISSISAISVKHKLLVKVEEENNPLQKYIKDGETLKKTMEFIEQLSKLINISHRQLFINKSISKISEQEQKNGKQFIYNLMQILLQTLFQILQLDKKRQKKRERIEVKLKECCDALQIQKAKSNKREQELEEKHRLMNIQIESLTSMRNKIQESISLSKEASEKMQTSKINIENAASRLTENQEEFKKESEEKQKIMEKISNLKTRKTEVEEFNKKLEKQIEILSKTKTEQAINKEIEEWMQQLKCNAEKLDKFQQIRDKIAASQSTIESNNKQVEEILKKIENETIEEVETKIEGLEIEVKFLADLLEKVQYLKTKNEKLASIVSQLEKLQKSQKQLCSCLTNHECDEVCKALCPNKKCNKKAGHSGDHLCEESNHKCRVKCAVYQNCNQECSEMFGHDESVQHNCNKSHSCPEKCQFCDDICSKSEFEMHENHICNEKKCPHSCILCKKPCSSSQHDHDNFIEIVEIMELNSQTNTRELVKRKMHICEDEHDCKELCAHPGICKHEYYSTIKKWNKNGSQAQYDYIEQVEKRNACKIKIPKGKIFHQNKCQCSVRHTCTHRCPDCRSLCHLEFNHPEQKEHETTHRNQVSLMYAAENINQSIQINKIVFKPGDISLPYKCDQSCLRKGRGHYHLVECRSQQQCLQKRYEYSAKHSTRKYHPHPEKKYDKVLCELYWKIHNFEMPKKEQIFNKCNFACTMPHGTKEPVYCSQAAWHSEDPNRKSHNFHCDQSHKRASFKELEICFLVDATASMDKHIESCKGTIKKIMGFAKQKNKNMSLKFGIVGYRDHPMFLSQINKRIKQLCPIKQNALQKLPIQPFHMQELTSIQWKANLAQLYQKLQLRKEEENIREQFDEKQLFILDFISPFVLDIPSDLMFEDLQMNQLTLLLEMLIGQQNGIPLKNHLLNSLSKTISKIQKQEQEEMKKKDAQWKLLEVVDLTTSQKAIQFLNKLKADGGGDPPEAVFDGMDAVTKLKWSTSKQTLKYVLHIFDAPPHGREYGSNQDKFPDGCPCGKKHEQIIEKLQAIDVNYIFYPLSERVNQTLEILKESGMQFKVNKLDKDEPEQFVLAASNLICEQIEQNENLITH